MDNKSVIIKNALQMFAFRGYDAVGVQEICIACEVTKPTLYHYYNSKRGLLDSILEKFYPVFLDKVIKAAEYHRDLVMNLEGIANVFFQFAFDNKDFIRFALAISFSPPDSEAFSAQKKYMEKLYCIIENLFVQAVNEHGNLRNKEKLLTASLIGLLNTFIALYLSNSIKIDETIERAIVKQFMHGIYS